MLTDSKAFSGFSVDDLTKAKEFYHDVLGLVVDEKPMGLTIRLGSGAEVFVYPKPDHAAAAFTILNFPVVNIDKAVDELVAAGVSLEHYEDMPYPQDEKGVVRNDDPSVGPVGIAWFKDPAGNILSILQLQ